HTSNLFYNDKAILLAEEICKRTGFSRVFFTNSGTEANEALIKLARRWHALHGRGKRRKIVATLGSFHGRTMGALSMTGQRKYHEGMEPLMGGVVHVPYDDLAAIEAVLDEETAAVIVEPIQGEGGIVVPSDDYLKQLRSLCDERGALLFFDEVQTGYGRTGRFLGREWSGVMPDACSLAKGMGGGFPIGAIAVAEHLADGLPPGSHGTTFGGNPLACAAGLAVLAIFDAEGLVERAYRMGQIMERQIREMILEEMPCALELRGRGLLRGVRLAKGYDPREALRLMREEGVLASVAGEDVIRLAPPLVVNEEEITLAVKALKNALMKLQRA
ncbi:MAG: aminotransferase class III-fold pyridoxal phosphate-dependent enzyme, partial [Deltaproteobacteria bacterium]|nr:aminotransferase class III-fold pyridoxal phosphate-dependent enzyme [Deltaproteobacteria bacterium]